MAVALRDEADSYFKVQVPFCPRDRSIDRQLTATKMHGLGSKNDYTCLMIS